MKNQISRSFGYNEKIFFDKPKEKNLFDDDFTFTYENNEYGNVLNNIDKLKEARWYKVDNDKKKEVIKELMQAGFLPDVTFSNDFTKIKRQNTEFLLKINK